MDTYILKEKSELFVFLLIFIQIAKLLTGHDLSWAFPTAYCYFYCHCQLSFLYRESRRDEDVLLSWTPIWRQRDTMQPSRRAVGMLCPHSLENSPKSLVKPTHFSILISPQHTQAVHPQAKLCRCSATPLYIHSFGSLSRSLKLMLFVLKTCFDFEPHDQLHSRGPSYLKIN